MVEGEAAVVRFERTDWEDQQRGRKRERKKECLRFINRQSSSAYNTRHLNLFTRWQCAGFYVGEYVTLLRDTPIGRGSDIRWMDGDGRRVGNEWNGVVGETHDGEGRKEQEVGEGVGRDGVYFVTIFA